ncbi:myoD family inhibitor domain-containing protein 2 [Mastacembelus armatus]|uniref:myoD family inhibitor domain-containing protein 2 n=1 Tax=Mastacembelus armatus TaxID=205130 RepID=UPI000E463E3A|nr:myoD family inhibitor domain-containing protein 2 [Mastacembelus armatus]
MDQMADEMTLRADVKDKERVNTAEESTAWVRGETIQSEAQINNCKPSMTSEPQPGVSAKNVDVRPPRECDRSSLPLFSLKKYLRSSSSSVSSTTDSLSSSQQSNMGDDCAGLILNCLFCRFYDMMLMVPDSCERVANHCCPNYKQVIRTVGSTPSSDDDTCNDLDCGLVSPCRDSSDCLELAMEVSELCYR